MVIREGPQNTRIYIINITLTCIEECIKFLSTIHTL